MLERITWQLDKLENDTLPQVDLNVTEVCVDGEGKMRRGKGGKREERGRERRREEGGEGVHREVSVVCLSCSSC